jgi:hypothetical protein
MRKFLGKKLSHSVEFMGDKINVYRLPVGETLELQKRAKSASDPNNKKAEQEQIKLIVDIVRLCAEGADDLTDEEILSFPLDELNRIAVAAMGQEVTTGNS